MIEKVIVRNHVYRKGELNTKFVNLTDNHDFDTINSFKEFYGDVYIMQNIFEENIDGYTLSDSLLFLKYEEILNCNKDNEYFSIMYKISDNILVSLSEHIYLYHVTNGLLINNERLLPWECVDGKKYIADIWWESDEEILEDLKNLSLIEFFDKYKAY